MREKFMHSTPLVTVIIPSYNHQNYVKKSILSVLNQTYSNIELIVIDDGSSDGSVKVIESLIATYDFSFIHRSNKGLVATLNEGLKLAKGEYWALVASDDFWDENLIFMAVDAMEMDEGLVSCFTKFYEVNDVGDVNGEGDFGWKDGITYDFEHVLKYADLPRAFFMSRKLLMLKLDLFNHPLPVEDLYLWLRLLENGGRSHVIDEPLAYYRVHDHNTHANNLLITKAHWQTLQYFIGQSDSPKAILREWALRNANILSRSDKLQALKYFRTCWFCLNDLRWYKILFKLLFTFK